MGAPKYPWDLIKVDYLAGLSPLQLQAKYGVPRIRIATHAYRNKWRDTLKTVTTMVTERVQNMVAADTAKFTEIVSKHTLDSLAAYQQRGLPTDPYEAQAHAGGFQKFVDIGRKTFGLESQASGLQTIVNVQVLHEVGEAIDAQVSTTVSSVGKTIDIPQQLPAVESNSKIDPAAGTSD